MVEGFGCCAPPAASTLTAKARHPEEGFAEELLTIAAAGHQVVRDGTLALEGPLWTVQIVPWMPPSWSGLGARRCSLRPGFVAEPAADW